ncbi:MAG: hypothetical protein ACRECD_05735 [Burkholderiaceae bacterium]
MAAPGNLIIRPRLKFLRVAHPEVVSYLESFDPKDLASVLTALVVRGVWDVTGQTGNAQGSGHVPNQTQTMTVLAPATDNAGHPHNDPADPVEGGLAAFGIGVGDMDAFEYN